MAEQTKRQQLELHLATRASQDPAFRERLLKAPKQTIEEEIGLHFPLSLEVKIHEEKLNELHIVLSINLETSGELPEEDTGFSERSQLPFWKRLTSRNRA